MQLGLAHAVLVYMRPVAYEVLRPGSQHIDKEADKHFEYFCDVLKKIWLIAEARG